MFMAGESPVSQAMTVNSKHNNSRFNKWLEILALKDLPTKHCKSENSGLKSSMRSGEKGNNGKPWSTENIP